jgi:plasmid stabilization system protein ParE
VLEIEVTPRALMQLRRAAKWWRANRLSVSEAVAEDFEHAVKLLAFEPGIGTRTESERYPELRRFQIDRVRHHIFYQVKKGKLVVLAFWGSEKEFRPKL